MSERTARLRVAVQSRDPLRRQGLRSLVAQAGHEPADAAEDADVLVCDVGPTEAPPRAGGAALLVLADQPRLDRDGAFAAVLPRDATAAQIQAALLAAAAGLIVRAPQAALPEPGLHLEEEDAGIGLLTPREVEILAAIGEGLSNKEVARRLGISVHTVKFHLEAIFAKLGAGSRAEAVAKGLRRGVIEL